MKSLSIQQKYLLFLIFSFASPILLTSAVLAGWFDSETHFLLLSGALLAILGVLAFSLSRDVARQLGGDPTYAVEIANRIAEGDLTTQVRLRPGDTRSVLHAIAQMQEELCTIVTQIQRNAQEVSQSVQQMSAQSTEISFASQMQAGSTQETTGTIAEITRGIGEISKLVEKTETHSENVAELSVQGERMVTDTVEGMDSIKTTVQETARQILRLKERSSEVNGIIQLIWSIAEQTNLLALNAAIEAARAGDRGRGFAVVAGEVRNLAERTAAATQEISHMIQSIQQDTNNAVAAMDAVPPLIDEGMAKSCNAAECLQSIKTRAAEVLENIRCLAQIADDQVQRARNIVENVEQITEMLKKTDAAVESATQTAVILEKSAAGLDQSVKMFTLDASKPTKEA